MTDEHKDFTHLRLRIEGAVQAVGYRNFVIADATPLGVDGRIRHRFDGTVEKLVGLCMRGPHGARVGDVGLSPRLRYRAVSANRTFF